MKIDGQTKHLPVDMCHRRPKIYWIERVIQSMRDRVIVVKDGVIGIDFVPSEGSARGCGNPASNLNL